MQSGAVFISQTLVPACCLIKLEYGHSVKLSPLLGLCYSCGYHFRGMSAFVSFWSGFVFDLTKLWSFCSLLLLWEHVHLFMLPPFFLTLWLFHFFILNPVIRTSSLCIVALFLRSCPEHFSKLPFLISNWGNNGNCSLSLLHFSTISVFKNVTWVLGLSFLSVVFL